MQCQKALTLVDCVQRCVCLHSMAERKIPTALPISVRRGTSDSYIPKRVRDCDDTFCHCGLSKKTTGHQGCEICTSDLMKAIKQTVASGKIKPELS